MHLSAVVSSRFDAIAYDLRSDEPSRIPPSPYKRRKNEKTSNKKNQKSVYGTRGTHCV